MTFGKFLVLLTVTFCFCSGCAGQKKPDGMPDLFPCQITITQNGTPLEGAAVIIFPKTGGSNGWNTTGLTNANGVAELMTHNDFKGAPAGEYVVMVTKTELSPSAVPDKAPTDPVEYEKWDMVKRSETRTTYRLVKAEFGVANLTPHSITVSQGKNEATFDVGEPIKEEMK